MSLDLEQPRAHERNKSMLEFYCSLCFNKYSLNQIEVSTTNTLITALSYPTYQLQELDASYFYWKPSCWLKTTFILKDASKNRHIFHEICANYI
jgi:hypothetical protein